mgnify:FL=1
MSLRPAPARWFELLTTRDDLTRAVEALARTGSIELETQSGTDVRFNMPDLQQRMEEFNRLSRRYHGYWPGVALDTTSPPGRPARILDKALSRLRAWEHDAAHIVQELEALTGERSDMLLVQEMLAAQQMSNMDYSLLAEAGPMIASRVYVLPADSVIKTLPASLLILRTHSDEHLFIIAVGPQPDLAALATDLAVLKGRELTVPRWQSSDHAGVTKQVGERLAALDASVSDLQAQLGVLTENHHIADALGDIKRMDWFMTHSKTLPVSENFAWVTGWTSDLDGRQIDSALKDESIHTLVHFPEAPEDSQPPMVMNNPWWAQPFELFASLLGTPARDEADPSRVLALLVPLVFGYMFGDVGQGLVIMLAGLLLKRRWPMAKLLVANGMAAILFGFVFGSVFGSEEIIPALWVHPIEHPLPVLLVPLAGGVIILLTGLILNAVESWWRGDFRRWMLVEAAVISLYLSLIAGYFQPVFFYLSLASLLWYLVGSVLISEHPTAKTVAASIGSLFESLFQLFINTISFVRVGAFALAHAGLSLAFYTMAATTASVAISFLILAIGNIIIILLEGLVVTIQTTRLVLFEFFIRFLRGTGRMFHPLAAPDLKAQTRASVEGNAE